MNPTTTKRGLIGAILLAGLVPTATMIWLDHRADQRQRTADERPLVIPEPKVVVVPATQPAVPKPNEGPKTVAPDVRKLEAFAQRLATGLVGRSALGEKIESKTKETNTVLSTDIRKTDSIVRPYVGEIVIDKRAEGQDFYMRWTLTLTLSENSTGKWELVKAIKRLESEYPERRVGTGVGLDENSTLFMRPYVDDLQR